MQIVKISRPVPLTPIVVLLVVLFVSRLINSSVFGKQDFEYWLETTAAFTAVSIHLVAEKVVTHVVRRLRHRHI